MTDGGFVQNAIGLRTGSAHSWTFRAVQNAKLNTALIGRERHGAAQSVDLFDQMPFADATNGWVAAHLPQGFDVV